MRDFVCLCVSVNAYRCESGGKRAPLGGVPSWALPVKKLMCGCGYDLAHANHSVYMEVRQIVGIGSFPSLVGSRDGTQVVRMESRHFYPPR